MSAGRIKISQMKQSDGFLRPEDLLHVVQMPHGENTRITVDSFRDYFSTLGYPRVWVTEGIPEESLGRDGDLCYATNPYPNSPGPWFFGPKDARMHPGNPWGQGVPLNQGPPGEGRINDIFYESLKMMRDDYSIRAGNNSMAAGPLDTNEKTINTNGGTLTIVGEEDLNPVYLNELQDVQHALPSEVVDRYALIWHEEAQVWKPGPAPHGPKGDKGDPGDAGMMLNFLGVVAEEADLPGWPDKYTGKGGDAYDVTAKAQIYAWSSFFRVWQGVTTLHGPPGADGKPGADGNDGADSTVPGPQGPKGDKGDKGDGWIGGSYNPDTGIATFNSDDGLTFSTTDMRGVDGKGWKKEGTQYNPETGIVTFQSDDGLGFETGDLRGKDGTYLPIFSIINWAGSNRSDLNDTGWYICDGPMGHAAGHRFAASVPDLRDRFVYGSLETASGQAGGSTNSGSTALTVDQMPQHSHTGSTSSSGSHSHGSADGLLKRAKESKSTKYNTDASAPNNGFHAHTFSSTSWSSSSSGSHTHPVSIANTGKGDGHTHTVMPPYYRLAYIIYLGS